ncbi:10193_t:CDS:2, partial [Dentiscutata erythropus]
LVSGSIVVNEYEDSGCHLWKLQVLSAILSFTVWFAKTSILVRFSFVETDMSLGIFVGAFIACLDIIR